MFSAQIMDEMKFTGNTIDFLKIISCSAIYIYVRFYCKVYNLQGLTLSYSNMHESGNIICLFCKVLFCFGFYSLC